MGRLSPPSKELERLLGERRFHHGGNPILRWMADNVEAERDAADNIKPSKKKSAEKIDGIVAAVMAISSWSANQRAKPKSKFQVYFFDQDTA
jgi:phage terminase large subunit-like protein